MTLIHKFCDQNHFLTQSFYTEKVLDDYEFNLLIDFNLQDAYTRVLKGQIDLALTVFPETTQGL